MVNENFQEEIKELYFYGISDYSIEKASQSKNCNWNNLATQTIKLYGIDYATPDWTNLMLKNSLIIRGLAEKLKVHYTCTK
jgi:hypothetical protein